MVKEIKEGIAKGCFYSWVIGFIYGICLAYIGGDSRATIAFTVSILFFLFWKELKEG